MSSLHVVIVTLEAPDPFGNAAARWYYAVAKGLLQRGHRVTFFSAYSPVTSEESLRRARDSFAELGLSLRLYPYPDRSWIVRKWTTMSRPYSFFLSDELSRDLQRCLSSGYDILHLEQMWTGYLDTGVERALLTVHHLQLIDLAEIATPSLRLQAGRYLMQRTERQLLSRARFVRVTTERLRSAVTKVSPHTQVFTVPVAIEPSLYPFVPQSGVGPVVGLIASIGWAPGYNAAVRLLTRIWPRVKRAVSNASLLVVGWDARRALSEYLNAPDVTVLENVPNVEEYFRRLCVLTYPLSLGSGMKIKLLEAMAYGTPVVTTSEGAEGLSAIDGVHALIADDDESLAENTIRLLRDSGLASRLIHSGRGLVEQEYSPGPVVKKLEAVYRSVLTGVQ